MPSYLHTTPNVFVGRFNYPNLSVGILNAKYINDHDDPKLWANNNYHLENIITLRKELINSSFQSPIKQLKGKLIDIAREISLSSKPVDIEIELDKEPTPAIKFNKDAMPHGVNVKLKELSYSSYPKIPLKVEKVLSDELKASEGLNKLYKQDFDVYYLIKSFTLGNYGIPIERKLVPTRWGITAVDDQLGKQLIKEIKDFSNLDYQFQYCSYLGNHYIILYFPDNWSYELFEMALSSREILTDYESNFGRTCYAESTAGGYYASRLSVLEYLKQSKRQAATLVLRVITDDYYAKMGVWVCRETAKKATKTNPISFNSKEDMLKFTSLFIKKKFDYDIDKWFKESRLLKEINMQNKLTKWIKN